MATKIQVSEPSPCCGSYYRTVNVEGVHRCNICGMKTPVITDKPDEKYVVKETGKTWSKKKHRYLKKGEV